MSAPVVVMVGGGYVSVFAYKRLARAASRGEVELVVVSPVDHHVFHGMTGEVVAGELPVHARDTTLARAMPLARHEDAHVTAVDTDEKVLTLVGPDGGRTLAYDFLVLGTGAREVVERTVGMGEHAFNVRTHASAARLVQHADTVVRRAAAADAAERDRLLTAVVVGAGLAGVEIGANLLQRMRAEAATHPQLTGVEPRLVLVHGAAEVAGDFADRPSVIRSVRKRLARLGVELHLSTRVSEVSPDGVTLTRAGWEAHVPAATVVATTGTRAVVPPGVPGERDERGRVVVPSTMELVPGVWAGGDMARVPYVRGGACPTNALWALHHGLHIGTNVMRVMRGGTSKPFRYPGLGRATSLGPGNTVATLLGVPILGWTGWWARVFFFLFRLPLWRDIPSVVRAWSPEREYRTPHVPIQRETVDTVTPAHTVMRDPVLRAKE